MKDIAYSGKGVEQKKDEVKPTPDVRSYHNDVSQLIAKGETTKIDVILAERARKEKERHESASTEGGHLGRIIFFLFLILAFGIGVGLYALLRPTPTMPFLSDVTRKTEDNAAPLAVLLTRSPREQILADIAIGIQKTELSLGQKRLVTFLLEEGSGDKIVATSSSVLNRLSLTPPKSDFLRSLDENIEFGILMAQNKVGYMKLSSRFYPETFAGMLSWEPFMGEDIVPALDPSVKRSELAVLRGKPFRDVLIAGHPARVLEKSGGGVILTYVFLDRKTLLITGGEEALARLIADEKGATQINDK